ncbi:hypothetical protein HYW54_02370 [Candidatus Gottesmanbacteria bacterium]|nr:hypothetical protein [Candidatus Gottesmanbacteria bacterium]
MLNWNVDEKRTKKEDPEGYKLWRLEQLLNYGFEKGEIDINELKKSWPKIKHNIDPYIARFTEFLLWGKLYSLPDNLNSWNWPPRKKK